MTDLDLWHISDDDGDDAPAPADKKQKKLAPPEPKVAKGGGKKAAAPSLAAKGVCSPPKEQATPGKAFMEPGTASMAAPNSSKRSCPCMHVQSSLRSTLLSLSWPWSFRRIRCPCPALLWLLCHRRHRRHLLLSPPRAPSALRSLPPRAPRQELARARAPRLELVLSSLLLPLPLPLRLLSLLLLSLPLLSLPLLLRLLLLPLPLLLRLLLPWRLSLCQFLRRRHPWLQSPRRSSRSLVMLRQVSSHPTLPLPTMPAASLGGPSALISSFPT
jgi:hypothetical protein